MGMKQTNIGEIPSDWKTINLENYFTLKARIGWQGLTTAEYLENGNYLLVTGTDFKDGKIDWKNCFYVDSHRYKQDSNIQLKENDVLVTKDGTIGKIAFIQELKLPATLNSGIFVVRPKRNKSKICPKFVFYVLRSFYFDNFLKKITAGSTITHLYQKDFVSFDLVLPPVKEQQKILSVLSDTDNLIQATEQLIDKKQQIKTATMQNLLTGKIRLAEFDSKQTKSSELGEIPSDWNHVKLGDIALIQRGASPRPIDNPKWFNQNSEIGWLRISDVSKSNKYLYNTMQNLSESGVANSRLVEKENLIMSICATVGKPIILKKTICIHDGFVVFNTLKSNLEFMYYILQSIEPLWSKNGQTGSQMNLNTTLISSTKILIPKKVDEQLAIANVLSDMDKEITALNQSLTKLNDIKQSLMQNLLTGKIRLTE